MNAALKAIPATWVVLGLAGTLAAVWDLSHGGFARAGASASDFLLLIMSVGAIAGGITTWRKIRAGAWMLCGIALIVSLYCIAFQLMVSLEFGGGWFVGTLLLLVFCVITLWSSLLTFARS